MFNIYEQSTLMHNGDGKCWELVGEKETEHEAREFLLEKGLNELGRGSDGMIPEDDWSNFYDAHKIEWEDDTE